MSNYKFTFIDLFSGIGGFRLALENNGGKCLGYSEINRDAINVYCDNFNTEGDNYFGDITKCEELPYCDVLTAGVPCQSWSVVGKRLGFDDERGLLWNDTLRLLSISKPKAFIFENVRGLTQANNKDAFYYIIGKINDLGYKVHTMVLNSADYGVPQQRERLYMVGFKDAEYSNKFVRPQVSMQPMRLADFLDNISDCDAETNNKDYFIFTDLRDGETTIHSWDLIKTTDREKGICQLILHNRRRRYYGPSDGNPLSLYQIRGIDKSVTIDDLDGLVQKRILRHIHYEYIINNNYDRTALDDNEKAVMEAIEDNKELMTTLADMSVISLPQISSIKEIRKLRVKADRILKSLELKGAVRCIGIRYDFKNGRNCVGMDGVYRIYMPTVNAYPTLVASDSNDYISTVCLKGNTPQERKDFFMNEIYKKGNFRKITKEEACRIQGFPDTFKLPEERSKWAKMLGNSVSVPIIGLLMKQIINTGLFNDGI